MNIIYKLQNKIKKYGIKMSCIFLAQYAIKRIKIFSSVLLSNSKRKVIYPIENVLNKNCRKTKVLYITDRMETYNGLTIKYRVFNIREAIKNICKTRFEIIENGIYKDKRAVVWADIIVLMRLDCTEKTDRLITIAKSYRIPVVYDVDDIIFQQDFLDEFCNILSDKFVNKNEYYKKKFAYQQMTLTNADFVTVTTPYLADIIRESQKKAFVIHNGVNRKQLLLAQKINHEIINKSDYYIGYLSGSATHDKDFLIVLPTLLKIMDEYLNVKLCIVGYLNIDNIPFRYRDRVKHIKFVKWNQLLKISATNYINIAPLNIESDFCNAKSELKFFESAIVNIPTVASATDTFKRCIVHGVNGMLASSEEDWYMSLKELIDDKSLYQRICENGYNYAIQNYSPKAIANEVITAYKNILNAYKKSNNFAE